MRLTILLPASIAVLLSMARTSASAASPFNGHWVDDLKTQTGAAGSDVYLVADGIYRCESCSPPRAYPADGQARAVPGDRSAISESVRIVDPHTIVTRIVGPDMTRETTMTVAPDGRTAHYVSLDKWPTLPSLLRTDYLAKRMAPAPAGSHAVSGAWLGVAYVAVPEEYRSVDLNESGSRFSRSNFRHGHYSAEIGGPAVPVVGDGRGIYKAMIKAPDAHTRTESILLNGKVVVERTFTLAPDGGSMETAVRDPSDGQVFRTISHRK
jgi:hypothetical protein